MALVEKVLQLVLAVLLVNILPVGLNAFLVRQPLHQLMKHANARAAVRGMGLQLGNVRFAAREHTQMLVCACPVRQARFL